MIFVHAVQMRRDSNMGCETATRHIAAATLTHSFLQLTASAGRSPQMEAVIRPSISKACGVQIVRHRLQKDRLKLHVLPYSSRRPLFSMLSDQSPCGAATLLRLPEEIHLPQRHAGMAQQGVQRRGVEIEVGQVEEAREVLALELQRLLVAARHADRTRLGPVDLLRADGLEEVPGLLDALEQLFQRGLGVRPARHLDAGQARRAALGGVAGDLDLTRQRQHVGRQPQGQIDRLVEALGDGVITRGADPGLHVGQHAIEHRHGGGVHVHGDLQAKNRTLTTLSDVPSDDLDIPPRNPQRVLS